MCVVCALWNLGKLTNSEARKGLSEMVNTKTIDKDHVKEVEELLDEADEEAKNKP
jgi:hypothetical protein